MGRVFEATDEDGRSGVAKFVPEAPGAERELLFGIDLSGLRNVVPVWDSGEHEDQLLLIMPRAEKSLRDLLDETAGALPTHEALQVLTDVALALADLEHRLVHRDLKPGTLVGYDRISGGVAVHGADPR